MTPLFFFGAMSPYSWFTAERIDELVPDAQWRPVLAGGVFKAADRVSWGLTDRRAAGMADCEERARAQGLGEIHWPDPWPTSDLLVARAMIVAQGHGLLRPFALAAMRSAFLEGGDLGELEVVRKAGVRAGLDANELGEGIADPGTKAALRRATEEAVAMGVVGVPTVVVEGALFWGDDRLEEAAAFRAASA